MIGYSSMVTNTGNVTLAGPVTVTDDKATRTCPRGGLTPGGVHDLHRELHDHAGRPHAVRSTTPRSALGRLDSNRLTRRR